MIKNIQLKLLTLAFSLLIIVPSVVSAALTMDSASINGGASATIGTASTTVVISTTGTISSGGNWRGTKYSFGTVTPTLASMSCYNNSNHNGNGTNTETFAATTPGVVGTYNLYIAGDDNDSCSGSSSSIYTLPNALVIQALAQTINFTAISPTATYGDAPISLSATASSGLPVTFSTLSASTICTVAGNTVTITGPGSCAIDANQAGNGTYAAAPTVTQTVIISPATLTVDTSLASSSKVYDATTTVSFITTPIVSGVIGGDDVGSIVGTYDTKNVGTGKTIVLSMNGPAANKYILSTNSMSGDITAKALAVTATGNNKTYDGTVDATVNYANDRILGDSITVFGTATFADKNFGLGKTVSVSSISLGGIDSGNYTPNTTTSTTADIAKLALTVTAVSDSKEYDGATTSIAIPTLSTTISGDSYTATQTFDTKNFGTLKLLTPAVVITDGNNGDNYVVTLSAQNLGTITAKTLSLTGISIDSKIYDKTDVATISTSTTPALVGVVAGDEANVVADFSGATSVYTDVNVGTHTVNITGVILTGSEAVAGNYVLSAVSTTGDIIARPITITPSTAAIKVYDGTNTSAGIPVILAGTLAGTDSISFTQVYDDKDVATGKTVSVVPGVVTDDNSGNNYAVTYQDRTDGVITVATLTVSALGTSKVYDGNVNASGITTLSDDRLSLLDTFTLASTSATFANKNIGTGKTITVSGLTKTGTGAGNYVFSTTTVLTTGDITSRTINPVAHVPNKVYDTNTGTTVTYTDDRVAGDIVGFVGSAVFNDKNAGASKLVLLTTPTMIGTDAINYTMSASSTTVADIYQASTTVSFTADSKVYDATTDATISSRTVSGILLGDVVDVSLGVATFANKNVGIGKIVTATGFVLGNTDGSNYVIAQIGTTTADITLKSITATVTADDKVYDTNATASSSCAVTPIFGDVVNCSVTGTSIFDGVNVGSHTVTATGMILSGTDATNYDLSPTTGTDAAEITPYSVTAVITTDSKVYDTTTTASSSCAVASLGEDGLTCAITGTSTFDDASATSSKTVTTTGIELTNNPFLNYVLTSTVATSTADITKAPISVSFTAENKVYDGNTSASTTAASSTGVFFGDDVTVTGGTATFDTASAGTGKTVSATGFVLTGANANDYMIDSVATTTADITKKVVTIAFTAANKVFDNTTSATISTRSALGIIEEDVVTVSGGTATFADSAIGNNKLVSSSMSGFTLGGAQGGNYQIMDESTATTSANITSVPVQTGGSQSFGGGISSGGFSGGITGGLTTGTPISSTGTSTVCDPVFTMYMKYGKANNKKEVIKLQTFLNKHLGLKIPVTGFFGTMTRNAVNAFQMKYATEILTPWGYLKPTGYVYSKTIEKLNTLSCIE